MIRMAQQRKPASVSISDIVAFRSHLWLRRCEHAYDGVPNNAFGNAIGNSIVDASHNAGVTRQTKSLLKDAGYAHDRDDHRSSAELTEKLVRAGATRDEALAILRNTEVRSALLDNDTARAGGISDELASTRAANFVDEQQRSVTGASGDTLEEIVVTGSPQGPSGSTITQKVFSGGIHLVEGLTQLAAENETLARFAYGAGKTLLTGGPLKTVITKLANVTFEGAVGAVRGELSGLAQTSTERFIAGMAQRNNISFDVSVGGITANIGPEEFGKAAGQIAGGAVDTLFDGGLKQIVDRGGNVRNIVRDERGRFKSDPLNPAQVRSTNGTHGNAAGTQPASLYEKYDAEGNFMKHGATQDVSKRYSKRELNGGYLIETQRGPRNEILKTERDLVETSPGPENFEPWAGKRKGGN